MGLEQHRTDGAGERRFAVITISDTRDASTDRGGDFLIEAVEAAGHKALHRDRVTDDAPAIEAAVRSACGVEGVELVLVTGGTGIAPRDVTVPTLEAMFESEIPGFGELFRALSFEQIGSATILSRACAGILAGRVVFALPGSPKALALAMERIILPEAGHLVSQLGR
jgi:molybdopterin adenylyltransferase